MAVGMLFNLWLGLRRAEFRTRERPAGLLQKLAEHDPDRARKESTLSRGLRQPSIAYLMSGRRFASILSRITDDLWNEFILYTRKVPRCCRRAFGTFMHHMPAAVFGGNCKSTDGAAPGVVYCCKYENIDARSPTRLPLLFALDAKLNTPDGFVGRHDAKRCAREVTEAWGTVAADVVGSRWW